METEEEMERGEGLRREGGVHLRVWDGVSTIQFSEEEGEG
jgi:hypothetical protein